MHRRLQSGMRENPASDRRHGSRFAERSEDLSNYVKGGSNERPNATARDDEDAIVSWNAAHRAATGGEKCMLAAETHARDSRRNDGAARNFFEPLIGSVQAARLLGNVHVKTLQRYARLGRLPGYQIGGHWYFRESELDAWLRNQINSNRQSVR
jgi:excisionase family DNA binding protein